MKVRRRRLNPPRPYRIYEWHGNHAIVHQFGEPGSIYAQ
jgi:hypothetical protein